MSIMNNRGIIIVLTILSITGTIGNFLTTLVYTRKKDKSTSTFFILVLSSSDLIVCLVLIPISIYMEAFLFQTESQLLCKLHSFLNTTIIPFGCLLMTTIAFDRYFSICRFERKIMNLKRARLVAFCLVGFSGLLGIIPTLSTVILIDQVELNRTNTSKSIL